MNDFVYSIPTKIYFGKDQLPRLGSVLAEYGKKVLLCYGGGSIKRTGLYDKVMASCKEAGLEVFELAGVEPNPRVETARRGIKICKEQGIDVILPVGGGSTIDCSKLIAAGACYDGDAWDIIIPGIKVEKALPIVTVLTLAATGSEMDGTAVISNPEVNEKRSFKSPLVLPKVSFMDPELTYSVSAYQTACGSADIMSHIMEIYFTTEDDFYMLDGFMESLMRTVVRFAPVAIAEPENYKARAELMWTSSWGINGFSDGGKQHGWSCHPMEHELSAFYDITHGLGLAILTPRWMRYCLDDSNMYKYVSFAENVFGVDKSLPDAEKAEQGIQCLEKFLFESLGLKSSLSAIGIGEENIPAMAEKACRGKFINGFKKLYPADVEKIYRMSL